MHNIFLIVNYSTLI